MQLLKLFETRCFTIAPHPGQKRRRRAAIRPRLGVESLEVRAMMDAQTDYDNAVAAAQTAFAAAQATQDAAYQAAVDSAGAALDSQAAPIAAGLDADTANLNQDLAATENSATGQYNSDLAAADQGANSIEQAADNTMNTTVTQAQSDLASQDAAYEQQTDGEVNQLEASLAADETQHESTYDSTVAADQATHDANIASEQASLTGANSTDGAQLQSQEDAIGSNLTAQNAAAANLRDSAIGGSVQLVPNQSVETDPGFMATYNDALTGYNNAVAAAQDTLNSAYATAEANDATSEQTYDSQMNGTIQGDADTFNSKVQDATNAYNSAVAGYQQGLDNTLAVDQAQHDSQYQQAETQFDSDSQGAETGLTNDEQAADTTYNQSAQPVIDAYNQFVTGRTASYNSQAQARQDQLNQELQQEQTGYNNAVAGFVAQNESQDADVIAAYDSAVQGLQQAQSSNDQVAMGAYSATVGPADQALMGAENTYEQTVMNIYDQAMQDGTDPDQGALDSAWNTLLSAKHQHANVVAQAEQALALATGADAVEFWTQEEPLYVTEQDGLATNDGNFLKNIAEPLRQLQDQQAASQASYETDIANDEASLDNDILTQYGTEQTTLRGFEDTRDKAYDLAEENYSDTMTTAYNTLWTAEIAAEQQQGVSDTRAYGDENDEVMGAWQSEQNQIAAAMAKQVHDDAAARTLNSQQVAGAMAQELNDEEAAHSAADSGLEAAAQNFLNQVAPAWIATVSAISNGDPGSIAVAQAWMNYNQQTLSNSASAQNTGDAAEVATLQDELQNWQNYISYGASQDEALANEVAAATVRQVSDDSNSIGNYFSQENADWMILSEAEIIAAAGEAGKELAAYVQDSLQYAIAELGRANGYVTAATNWIDKVIPQAVTDQQSLNNDAAGAIAALEPLVVDFAQKIDQAQENETLNLIAPAQTEINSIAQARQTYVIDQAKQQAADANNAAAQNTNDVANAPDSNFAGEEPGNGGMPMGEVMPNTPAGPNVQQIIPPPQLSDAEQKALDTSRTLKPAIEEAKGILDTSGPELTALLAAAWNAANNLSITTNWNSYPVGSGRPHCADYAGAMLTAMKNVQQQKFTLENKAVEYIGLGYHGIVVTDKASGKYIYVAISPGSYISYNSGLDGYILGPTFKVFDLKDIEDDLQWFYHNYPDYIFAGG